MPCDYEAYLPDPIAGSLFSLEGDVAADVADAERALAELNRSAATLVDTEALARILLRAESVASSRIEGLVIGARRLLHAEAAQVAGIEPSDVTAAEVLNNIRAMALGVQQTAPGEQIDLDKILAVHRELLIHTSMAVHAGRLRTVQNWIGGSSYTPKNAPFVPPPPHRVPKLMEDLLAFSNQDDLPAVAQAAIAHAQFETIHPFADGNGRTGRALTHLILRRRNLTPRVMAPVSLVLATHSQNYIAGLTEYRSLHPTESAQAQRGINAWIATFAGACLRATEHVIEFEQSARAMEQQWREKLGTVRTKSTIDILLPKLIGAPVLTVNTAAALLGRSFPRANDAIARLVEAGILQQISIGGKQRNRAFEAPSVLEAFKLLERGLASPAGDTRVERPARPMPRR